MEDNMESIESLFEKTVDYGKTNYELFKLRLIDKVSDGLSSLIPLLIILILIGSFLVFINLGIALWIGEMIGNTYYGFFIVGGFYGLVTLIFYFFTNKRIKRIFYDFFVRKIIKAEKSN